MRLKHYLRMPLDLPKARRLLARPSGERDGGIDSAAFPQRPVVLDLCKADLLIDGGRHLLSLAFNAAAIDSPLTLRCRRWLLAAIAHKPYGAKMLALPHVEWLPPDRPISSEALLLRDHATDLPMTEPRGPQTPAYFQMLIGRQVDNCDYVMPYPIYPGVQAITTPNDRQAYRATSDRNGILFAGNQNAKYDKHGVSETFGVLDRLTILRTLRSEYMNAPSDAQTGRPLILRDTAKQPVAVRDWLSYLAGHQFFVCCPGVNQPLCHNAIEAMSVGTVPIIEFGDRFHPVWTDGVNAIGFRGRAGLIEAVDRARRLSDAQVKKMSSECCRYFDQHLCGATFLRRLRDEADPGRASRLAMPFHNRNLFRDAA